MFARSISIHLKPDSVVEFTRLIDEETLPLLWKQEGFQDEMTFIVAGGAEAFEISLWDHKENADAFNRNVYPRALKTWENVVEGTPEINTYEVCSSSFHKIASCASQTSQKHPGCAKHASPP